MDEKYYISVNHNGHTLYKCGLDDECMTNLLSDAQIFTSIEACREQMKLMKDKFNLKILDSELKEIGNYYGLTKS